MAFLPSSFCDTEPVVRGAVGAPAVGGRQAESRGFSPSNQDDTMRFSNLVSGIGGTLVRMMSQARNSS